jgi:hypothetical protein
MTQLLLNIKFFQKESSKNLSKHLSNFQIAQQIFETIANVKIIGST